MIHSIGGANNKDRIIENIKVRIVKTDGLNFSALNNRGAGGHH